MKDLKKHKLVTVNLTLKDWNDALRVPPPYRDKTKYYKKIKHKGRQNGDFSCLKLGSPKYCSYIYT